MLSGSGCDVLCMPGILPETRAGSEGYLDYLSGAVQVIQYFVTDHIIPRKQPIPLEFTQRHYGFFVLPRPLELRFFQALKPQTKASLIPIQHLNSITVLVAKHKQPRRKR